MLYLDTSPPVAVLTSDVHAGWRGERDPDRFAIGYWMTAEFSASFHQAEGRTHRGRSRC